MRSVVERVGSVDGSNLDCSCVCVYVDVYVYVLQQHPPNLKPQYQAMRYHNHFAQLWRYVSAFHCTL